ncbi:MAG: hypothetical protein KJ850_10425 [Gammaproteobacteria bacterium]|nr:hypothetical protein [Gammaproteobacteria bacterium]MBU1625445.1 hypothetical protein [Gammaproteobacteria bacterium]MBU1981705.1 hypothetical protein [Gammaproteobacteria bacterium]
MAAWLIPVIKTILPHVGTIISAAAPVFTRKSGDAATLQQQVTELQSAASANDANIKNLAEQMQIAIEALEKGTKLAQRAYRHAMLLGIAAFIISLTALSMVLINLPK